MRTRRLALAVAAVVAVVGATVGTAAPARSDVTTLRWRAGWDDTTQPLNYQTSYVSFDTGARHALTITYHLEGAVPGSSHYVGLHLFPRPAAACVPRLGQYRMTPCGSITREGVTATVQAVDFVVLRVDASGTGHAVVKLKNVKTGNYRAEFGVRTAACKACAYIYQAPGPFGTVVRVPVKP